MPAELVEAAEILVGSGAAGWVVDKLLGPSASALGEQIKVYGTGRFRSVVSVFATKAETRQHDLQALPPGFAYQFFQKASFSEDDEFITECWANLLLSAATEYAPRLKIAVVLQPIIFRPF